MLFEFLKKPALGNWNPADSSSSLLFFYLPVN